MMPNRVLGGRGADVELLDVKFILESREAIHTWRVTYDTKQYSRSEIIEMINVGVGQVD